MTKFLIAAIFAIRTLSFDDCDDVEKQEFIEGDALRVELMQRKLKQPPAPKATQKKNSPVYSQTKLRKGLTTHEEAWNGMAMAMTQSDETLMNISSPQVTYDHMPKTGGTYLISILEAGVGAARFNIISEFDGVDYLVAEDSFTIGSMRNPCDLYVSLWAFGADGAGTLSMQLPQDVRDRVYGTTSPNKDSPEDVEKFRDWLRTISVLGQAGTLTIRLAISYGFDPALTSMNLVGPASQYSETVRDEANAVMAAFDPERIDCWIYTENMTNDARICLQLWEVSNVDGGRVDWEPFEVALQENDQHSSSHGPCKTYFDDEAEQLVWSTDRLAFEKFGYTSCCAELG
jgi:hypothetical protein